MNTTKHKNLFDGKMQENTVANFQMKVNFISEKSDKIHIFNFMPFFWTSKIPVSSNGKWQ